MTITIKPVLNVDPGVSAGGSIHARMGQLLGLTMSTEADAVRVATKGVSVNTLTMLSEQLGFQVELVLPSSTFRRRVKKRQSLSGEETERLMRVTRVFAAAEELFGDKEAATRWLSKAEEFVPGQPAISPFQLAETDNGARLVETVIARTAYGF